MRNERILSSLAKSTSRRSELKKYRLMIPTCFVLLALAATFAQTPPSDAALTSNPVFKKNCANCHGKTADGHHFGGPSLISEKTANTSTEDLRNIIANGKGHMPKFASKLKSEEIDMLVQQISALNKR